MKKVGILGASGLVGAELMRFLSGHSEFDVVFTGANTAAGKKVSDLYPELASSYEDTEFSSGLPSDKLDLIFLAMAHGESSRMIEQVLASAELVVDLAADFRLAPESYESAYGSAHPNPDKCASFITGLPEFNRSEIKEAKSVAVPGCYPTAVTLALKPLLDDGLIQTKGIIVNAASGVSGAGRTLSRSAEFCSENENFAAYKLLHHRHTPEMEELLGTGDASILFTPHLAPMNRGILATCYAMPADNQKSVNTQALMDCYEQSYESEPFVDSVNDPDNSPATKDTLASNTALVNAVYDQRTETAIAMCAIDNLGKGAAGQGIQCANLMCGLEETLGLEMAGTAGVQP